MELEELDLSALSILYSASQNNVDLKVQIEAELQKRIATNNTFSRERLFEISVIQNHAIGMHFIPTSAAFNSFGANITVEVSDNNDLELFAKNLASDSRVNTYGNIRLKALVIRDLTQGQIDALQNEGIDTSDISSILQG